VDRPARRGFSRRNYWKYSATGAGGKVERLRGQGLGVVGEICAQLLRRRVLRGTWGTAAAAETSGCTKRVVVVFFFVVLVVTWVVVVRVLIGQPTPPRRRTWGWGGKKEKEK
jgi:hypothetical protein